MIVPPALAPMRSTRCERNWAKSAKTKGLEVCLEELVHSSQYPIAGLFDSVLVGACDVHVRLLYVPPSAQFHKTSRVFSQSTDSLASWPNQVRNQSLHLLLLLVLIHGQYRSKDGWVLLLEQPNNNTSLDSLSHE